MEKLSKPQVEDVPYEKVFKLALLNSRKSSLIGILLVAMPVIILVCQVHNSPLKGGGKKNSVHTAIRSRPPI